MATRVVSKTINLDAPIEEVSKYITDITDTGIQIHPKQWDRNTSTYVQIDGEGFSIFDGIKQIAQYGEDAIIGDEDEFHIKITANYENSGEPRLSFYRDGNNEVAYISGDKLYITQSVVLQQMDVGTQVINGGLGQWSWKVHEVNDMNNLYLKWLG